MKVAAFHPVFSNSSPESIAKRKMKLVFHPASELSLWQRLRRCLLFEKFANVDICWNEYTETKEGNIRRKICHLRRICVQNGLVTEVLENSGYINSLHPAAKIVEIDCFVPLTLNALRKAIRTNHPVSVNIPTHRSLFYQKEEEEKPKALFCELVQSADESQTVAACDHHRNKPLYWPHILVDALNRSRQSQRYVRDADGATLSIDELYQLFIDEGTE